MFWRVAARVVPLATVPCFLACALLEAQETGKAVQDEAPTASVRLYDTGVSSPAPLAGESLLRKSGWIALPEDQTTRQFTGDAVLLNDRLAVVLRRGGPGAELYARAVNGFIRRALLAPTAGGGDVRLASVAVAENTPAEAAVDASFQSSQRTTLGLRMGLAAGQLFVRTEAGPGATGLAVEAPSRFVVLPDFFADDIVVDAAEIPVAAAELPSENFLLHLLPGADAIVMSVASSREQDARVTLSGSGAQRVIQRSEMDYGKAGKIWVALLEGRDVWHQREVTQNDANQVIPLDWTMPFPAQWRVDWRQADGLVSSWEMITEKNNGEFEKHGWFGNPSSIAPDRKRWTTVLGSFRYPCWVDRSGKGYLQPLPKKARFQGPALIYPINRVKATPLGRFTVVDIVRATLGVGPCQYILDVEGQGASHKGRATCATRDALKEIYARGQQRQKRAEIQRILSEVVAFVKHIRGRIEQYVAFGHEMLAYLKQQREAHPELAGFVTEMETLTKAIDAGVEKRRTHIKTPQYVVDLTEQFRNTLLDYEGDDALAKCTAITHAIVDVGGNQDELVGECRMAVKVLRQRAGLAMAVDPRTAEVAKEIRRRTQDVLRNATSYEAPRH